uniref:YCF2 protein n=1 Tax=Rhizophora mucronata TaxID=61149 RepID=A0A2P2MKN6_RHIMU
MILEIPPCMHGETPLLGRERHITIKTILDKYLPNMGTVMVTLLKTALPF